MNPASRRIIGVAVAVVLAGTFWLGLGAALAGPTDGVVGCWRTVDEETKKVKSLVCFRIDQKDGKLYGRITKLYNPTEKDPKCVKCKGALKDKPILGLTIVSGLSKEEDAWAGGRILDPEKGKDYRCKIWREGDKLMVRGYWAIFHRTQTWIK